MRYPLLFIVPSLLLACTGEDNTKVPNTEPSLTGLEIGPSSDVTTSSLLICMATAIDADNDAIQIIHSWTNQAGEVLSDTDTLQLSPEIVQPTEVLTCTVEVSNRAEDSTAEPIVETVQVTVENTAPALTEVLIGSEDNPITSSSLLSCSAEASDADAETPIVAYEWTQNGTVVGSENSVQLDTASYSPADVIACTVTATDGYEGVTTSTAEITLSNRIPLINAVTITPNENVVATGELLCSADVNDADEEELSTSASWTNTNGDELSSDFTLALDTTIAPVDEVLTCTITTTDGGGASGTESASITIVNSSPSVTSTAAISSNPDSSTGSVLTCSAAFDDLEDGALNASYEWTNTTAGTSVASGDTYTITAADTNPGDVLTCTATVTDANGAVADSTASLSVTNTGPAVSSAALISASTATTTGSTLTCAASFEDDDEGSLSATYSWTNDTTNAVLGSGDTYTITAADTNPGDSISCTAAATDSDGASNSSTDTVIVVNTNPTVTGAATISPASAFTNSALLCSASFDDLDDGSLTASYEWTNTTTGAVIGSGDSYTVSSAETSPGDVLTCTASAADQNLAAIDSSTTITIENTAPTISSAAAITTPASATTGATLTCSASFDDLDDGSLTASYEWTNAAGAIIGSSDAYVISATDTDPGELLTCTASAIDANQSSIDSSTATTVINTAPTAPGISVNSAELDEALTCTIDAVSSDIDQQSITYDYVWLDDQGAVAETSSATLDTTNSTTVALTEGTWTCQVTATDGVASSTVVEATGTVSPLSIDRLIPGDLVITEIMNDPSAVLDSDGEWFEVYNASGYRADLDGLLIEDASGAAALQLSGALIIEDSDYAVFARNGDDQTNGGVIADDTFGFALNNGADTLTLSNSLGVLDSVGYDNAQGWPALPGSSMSLTPGTMDATSNDDVGSWCLSSSTYGAGDRGTPGAMNDATCAYTSCAAIKAADPAATDGVYTIIDDSGAAIDAYCEMDFLGGGWLAVYNMVHTGNTATEAANMHAALIQNQDMLSAVDPTSTSSAIYTSNISLSDYEEVVFGWAPAGANGAIEDVQNYGLMTNPAGLAGTNYLDGYFGTNSVVGDFYISTSGNTRTIFTGDQPSYPHVGLGFSGQIIVWGYDLDHDAALGNNAHWGNWYDSNICCNAGADANIANSGWRYVIYVR